MHFPTVLSLQLAGIVQAILLLNVGALPTGPIIEAEGWTPVRSSQVKHSLLVAIIISKT